jgi:type IV pilus assembly protein PilC
MAIFSYTAKDSDSRERTGTVDSRSKEIAVNLLKSQGLYIVRIKEKKSSFLEELLNFRGIPFGETVQFTRQFATMIGAGLPISRALNVLAEQTQNKMFKKIIYDVLRSVESGTSLSSAMGRYPNVFSTTYQALVNAGESSGKLDTILLRLADTMEAERELSSTFKAAMVYPSIVFVAMIGVFFILMVFVVPKLADMYISMNVELPVITQTMITISDFMVKYKIIIVVGGIFGVLLLRYFAKSEIGKYYTTELLFKIPVFGKINSMKELASFTRTLSLLMASAVPIVESLKITASVVSSSKFKSASIEAGIQVEKGNTLSGYFKSNEIFPPVVGQMASVGEETGKMDEILERIAGYYDGEVNHLVKGLSAALEPIILVMLGSMVGFLIVSIITPIYKITSAI